MDDKEKSNYKGISIFGAKKSSKRFRSRNKNNQKAQHGQQANAQAKQKNKDLRNTGKKQTRRQEPKKMRTDYPEGAITQIKVPSKELPELQSDVSQEKIDNAYTALYDEQRQQLVSFDEAIEILKSREQLAEDESLLYAGRGSFAVVAYVKEGRKRKQVITRKVEFEKNRDSLEWRDSLRFDLTLSYQPNPDPLADLYTDEEIIAFSLNKK